MTGGRRCAGRGQRRAAGRGAHTGRTSPPPGGRDVVFCGVVRDHDDGRHVVELEYEAHPSAEAVLREVAAEIAREPDVLAVAVSHRIGVLAVGDDGAGGGGGHGAPAVRRSRSCAPAGRRGEAPAADMEAAGLRRRHRRVGQLPLITGRRSGRTARRGWASSGSVLLRRPAGRPLGGRCGRFGGRRAGARGRCRCRWRGGWWRSRCLLVRVQPLLDLRGDAGDTRAVLSAGRAGRRCRRPRRRSWPRPRPPRSAISVARSFSCARPGRGGGCGRLSEFGGLVLHRLRGGGEFRADRHRAGASFCVWLVSFCSAGSLASLIDSYLSGWVGTFRSIKALARRPRHGAAAPGESGHTGSVTRSPSDRRAGTAVALGAARGGPTSPGAARAGRGGSRRVLGRLPRLPG